jgi:Fuc2NAc and GlcNAc transferase
MGDVGSGFVGFFIAVLIVECASARASLGWGVVILTGVFAVDAAVTLAIRIARRERVLQAHRSHAYQMLAARWGAHRPVTLLCLAVNLFWLLPIAAAVALGRVGGIAGMIAAWMPIAAAVLWVNRTAAEGERVS